MNCLIDNDDLFLLKWWIALLTMMDFVSEMMDFMSHMMDFVLTMMNFVYEWWILYFKWWLLSSNLMNLQRWWCVGRGDMAEFRSKRCGVPPVRFIYINEDSSIEYERLCPREWRFFNRKCRFFPWKMTLCQAEGMPAVHCMPDYVLKLMDCAFKMINFVLKLMDFALKMMNCVLNIMDFAFKMMNFVLPMMDFALKWWSLY